MTRWDSCSGDDFVTLFKQRNVQCITCCHPAVQRDGHNVLFLFSKDLEPIGQLFDPSTPCVTAAGNRYDFTSFEDNMFWTAHLNEMMLNLSCHFGLISFILMMTKCT